MSLSYWHRYITTIQSSNPRDWDLLTQILSLVWLRAIKHSAESRAWSRDFEESRTILSRLSAILSQSVRHPFSQTLLDLSTSDFSPNSKQCCRFQLGAWALKLCILDAQMWVGVHAPTPHCLAHCHWSLDVWLWGGHACVRHIYDHHRWYVTYLILCRPMKLISMLSILLSTQHTLSNVDSSTSDFLAKFKTVL